jgi:hypothetical protein
MMQEMTQDKKGGSSEPPFLFQQPFCFSSLFSEHVWRDRSDIRDRPLKLPLDHGHCCAE